MTLLVSNDFNFEKTDMDLKKAHDMAIHEISRFYELSDWKFGWNRRKTSLGICWHGRRRIELSRLLTEREPDEELILDTIRHEIAHALVGPEHGHDAVWRGIARLVGCKSVSVTCKLSPGVQDFPMKYALVIDLDGREEIVQTYHRRPSQRFLESLPNRHLRGRPDTMGMIRLKPLDMD